MATQPSENKPAWLVTNPARRIEPSESKKTQGWSPLEPFPAQNANWLLYSISVWIAYLVEAIEELIPKVGIAAGGSEVKVDAFTIGDTDDGKLFFLDPTGGSFAIQLRQPSLFANKKFDVKDITGLLNDKPITLVRHGTEKIENLQADFELNANFGEWTIYCDGEDYWLL